MAAAPPHARRADGDITARATQDLYQRYGRQIYAYCLHQLRSREEAEDAVQTTFLNAFRGLKSGTEPHAEQAWLYKIALNVCNARRQSSARRLRLETPNDFEILQETVPAQESGGADELFGLDDALERMPENQRRAILLREWQGLSYREIGEEMELSQAAVEMLIFRARRTLAGALEKPAEQKQLKRKVGRSLNLGSIAAAIKSLLTGGAAVKAVALAVAAGTASIAATGAVHTIVHKPAAKPRAVPTHALIGTSAPTTRSVLSTPGAAAPLIIAAGPRREGGASFAVTGGAPKVAADESTATASSSSPDTAGTATGEPVVPVEPVPHSTPVQQITPAPSTPADSEPSPPPSAPHTVAPTPSSGVDSSPPPSPTTAPTTSQGSSDTKAKGTDKDKGKTAAVAPTTTTPAVVTTTVATVAPPPPAKKDKKAKLVDASVPIATTPATTTTTTSTTTAVTTTLPTPAPAPPAPSDDGKAKGKEKEKTAPAAPVATTPVTTTATTTAPVTTTVAAPPPAPPAPADNGNGKDKAHGHGK